MDSSKALVVQLLCENLIEIDETYLCRDVIGQSGFAGLEAGDTLMKESIEIDRLLLF